MLTLFKLQWCEAVIIGRVPESGCSSLYLWVRSAHSASTMGEYASGGAYY